MQTIAVLPLQLQGLVQFGSTRKVSDTPNCNLRSKKKLQTAIFIPSCCQ